MPLVLDGPSRGGYLRRRGLNGPRFRTARPGAPRGDIGRPAYGQVGLATLHPGSFPRARLVRRIAYPPRRLLTTVGRGRFLFALDLVGIVLASYLAVALLQFDEVGGAQTNSALPIVVALLLAARTIANIKWGLYSRRWRYASIPELERIAAAVVLGSVISIIVFYGASDLSLAGDSFPRSFWVAEALQARPSSAGCASGSSGVPPHEGLRQLAPRGPRNPAVWSRSSGRRCRPVGAARARRRLSSGRFSGRRSGSGGTSRR